VKYICTGGIFHDWEDTTPGPYYDKNERELRDCPDHSPHESEGQDHREMQEMARGEA
jgi:hypothetical protein